MNINKKCEFWLLFMLRSSLQGIVLMECHHSLPPFLFHVTFKILIYIFVLSFFQPFVWYLSSIGELQIIFPVYVFFYFVRFSHLIIVTCTCIFKDDTPNLCTFYENNHWLCGSQFIVLEETWFYAVFFFYFLQGKCIDEMCKYVLHVRKGILLTVWQKAIV